MEIKELENRLSHLSEADMIIILINLKRFILFFPTQYLQYLKHNRLYNF